LRSPSRGRKVWWSRVDPEEAARKRRRKGPDDDFLVGCNTVFDTAGKPWTVTDANTAVAIHVILNVSTGNIVQVPLAGAGDEVWFNSGDGNYYTASSTSPLRPLDISGAADAQGAAVLGVIDAKDKNLIQLVPTFNVPAVTGTGAHPAEGPLRPSGSASASCETLLPRHAGACRRRPARQTGPLSVTWRRAAV
jgi:hypothetical protein